MFSSHLTLKEFVRSVSTCQQEVDLETLLTLFRSSQQTTIVIVDRQQKPIGILDYHRLLPLIAKHWLNSLTPALDLDKFGSIAAPAKQDCSAIFTHSLDLNSLKEPIVSLSSQMGVKNFLLYLNTQSERNKIDKHYTIVDVQGKLLGLLDVTCLIETISGNWQDRKTTVSQNQSGSHWLCELLAQTPLPIMLQAAEGHTLYQNRFWQEQVSIVEEFSQSKDTVTSFLQQQQSSVVYSSNWQSTLKPYHYCLKGDYHLFSKFSLLKSNITVHAPDILANFTLAISSDRSSIEEDNPSFSLKSIASIPASAKTDSQNIWQYIKFPIDWTDDQCSPTNCSQKCWLILAIPNCQIQQLTTQATKDEELRELIRWKEKWLAKIAHELKSPLTAIVGLSNLLKEQKLGTLNQRQLRYTELIYRSGQQLVDIVNNLFDWNRLATTQLELNLEAIKIRAICEEVYQQIIAVDRANNLRYFKPKFNLEIEPSLEIIVADRLHLSQILTHLLNKVFKSIAPEEEIGITVTLWSNWLAIIVWNTKKDILGVSQSLVLEQLNQSQTSSLESKEELELVLAQQLAREQRGDISFFSTVDKGSEFTLLLPYGKKNYTHNFQFPTQSTEANLCDHQNNLLILVIETVSHHIDNLASQLQDLGYHPIIARTVPDALYKARRFKPSTILLNSSFSLHSGDSILTLLKSDPLTANIPVWLITEDKQKQQKDNGIDGLLSVPIDKRILAQVLSLKQKKSWSDQKKLTILYLCPDADAIVNEQTIPSNFNGDFALKDSLYNLHHRLIEADSLTQGEILARIWQLDLILLDGSLLSEPLQYLHSLRECELLAALPLITLDAKTTEAANQIDGLSVFPCLVPANQRSLTDLLQVIQIASVITHHSSVQR
jgi:signal transduction histidine kinase/DNA-binding response OmpR family regulator